VTSVGRGGKLGLLGGVLTLLAITAYEGSIVPGIVSVEIITAERRAPESVSVDREDERRTEILFRIPLSARNVGTIPVFLATNCTGRTRAFVEQRTAEEWGTPVGWEPVVELDCGGPFVPVTPGETYAIPEAYLLVSVLPDEAAVLEAGVFRVQLAQVYEVPDHRFDRLLPEEHRISNTFELTVP